MPGRHYVKKSDMITREIVGGTIIVPIRRQAVDFSSIYTLKDIGSMIWQRIEGQTTVNEIFQSDFQEFDLSPGVAAKDTLDYLQALEAVGLIEAGSED